MTAAMVPPCTAMARLAGELAAAGLLRVTSQLLSPVLMGSGQPGTAARLSAITLLLLSAGTLAAHSLARIGHVAGIAGLVASGVVLTALLVVHRRPGAVRAVARRTMTMMRRLSTTIA